MEETPPESLPDPVDRDASARKPPSKKGKKKFPDSHAREIALQALYQVDVIASPLESVLRFQWLSSPPAAHIQSKAESLIQSVYDNWDSLDDVVRSLSSKDITQISTISRCILRMGLFELMELNERPGRVLDDLLNLTRTYDGEDAVPFVNGILDRFIQEKQLSDS